MTTVAKDRTIAALATEYDAVSALLETLTEGEWALPTPCPGWDVRAQVAHLIGTESSLAGLGVPDELAAAPAHVRNEVGAFNERWVAALADVPGSVLIERWRDVTGQRLGSLRAMDRGEWNREGVTPAGRDTYGRFMRIRVFDCWMHEQDIRDAIGRPGHESGPVIDLSLDEIAAGLGYVIGKKAGAPAGTSVTFDLIGAPGRVIHVRVAERAEVVDGLEGVATSTLRMPVGTFTRLCGGRTTASAVAAQTQVDGDSALGRAVVDNLAFTI